MRRCTWVLAAFALSVPFVFGASACDTETDLGNTPYSPGVTPEDSGTDSAAVDSGAVAVDSGSAHDGS
jgi:hypothetical protein